MKLLASVLTVMALCVLASCGASVKSTVMPDANLGKYQTYSWFVPHGKSSAPLSTTDQEIRDSISRSLAKKGLVENPSRPDFLIAYHVALQEKVEDWGYGWYDVSPHYTTYTVGTLIVDFIDPATNKAFWRGTASQVVDNPANPNPDKVDKAVSKLIKKYPARVAGAGASPTPTM
jgi:hypothetical protein